MLINNSSPPPNSYCIVNLLVLRTTWWWPTYKAETCSCCIFRSVAYYIVILSDKLLCFCLHVYVNTHIIIYIVLLNVKLRWQHVMTYLLQISFTFLSSAALTRHLILLPNGEAVCGLIINETFGNPSCINLVIFEGVLHDLICRTMNPPVSALLKRSERLKILCHPHLFSHI